MADGRVLATVGLDPWLPLARLRVEGRLSDVAWLARGAAEAAWPHSVGMGALGWALVWVLAMRALSPSAVGQVDCDGAGSWWPRWPLHWPAAWPGFRRRRQQPATPRWSRSPRHR